nr:hypothetical protein [uncultured Actinoplanes sp.]
MSQPPQPPYSGQPQPGEPYPGQPYPGQQYPGQPSPGQPQYPATPYPAPQEPWSGSPNPDHPSSVPPQPGYPPTQQFPVAGPPPDYVQQPPPYDPAQPYYGPPGFPPPEPPKAKSRALPIVLTSIAIFLVLCVGGSTVAVLIFKNNNDKLTAADATPDPTSTTGGATAEPTEEATDEPTRPLAANVKIVEPKTLGGRPKLNNKEFKSTIDLLKTIMSSYPTATSSVGAMYGRAGTRNIVLMTAAKAEVDDPETTVDGLLASGGSKTKVSGITSASTGALGGVAKCGNTSNAGQKVAICVWADGGSLGLTFWYFKSAASIKGEFPKVRAEIERKA